MTAARPLPVLTPWPLQYTGGVPKVFRADFDGFLGGYRELLATEPHFEELAAQALESLGELGWENLGEGVTLQDLAFARAEVDRIVRERRAQLSTFTPG